MCLEQADVCAQSCVGMHLSPEPHFLRVTTLTVAQTEKHNTSCSVPFCSDTVCGIQKQPTLFSQQASRAGLKTSYSSACPSEVWVGLVQRRLFINTSLSVLSLRLCVHTHTEHTHALDRRPFVWWVTRLRSK